MRFFLQGLLLKSILGLFLIIGAYCICNAHGKKYKMSKATKADHLADMQASEMAAMARDKETEEETDTTEEEYNLTENPELTPEEINDQSIPSQKPMFSALPEGTSLEQEYVGQYETESTSKQEEGQAECSPIEATMTEYAKLKSQLKKIRLATTKMPKLKNSQEHIIKYYQLIRDAYTNITAMLQMIIKNLSDLQAQQEQENNQHLMDAKAYWLAEKAKCLKDQLKQYISLNKAISLRIQSIKTRRGFTKSEIYKSLVAEQKSLPTHFVEYKEELKNLLKQENIKRQKAITKIDEDIKETTKNINKLGTNTQKSKKLLDKIKALKAQKTEIYKELGYLKELSVK